VQDGAVTAVEAVAGYRRFLAARDGAPDLRRHTLARREAFFAALDAAPVRSQAAIDRDAYRRNLSRRRVEAGLDDRVLWLLASAKANQAERFGVGLCELYGRVPTLDEDPVRLHLHLQELYHTRILADVVALFDLPVHRTPPPIATRTLIKGLVLAPPRWTLPGVGFAEMVGCALFRALRDRGVALFAGEPAVAERVRLLYDEILADEISHVGFVTAQLGSIGRRLMVWLYRRFGMRLATQMPELVGLFGAAELARQFEDFRLGDFVAEVGDRAYGWSIVTN
jgi:hypothetical protein